MPSTTTTKPPSAVVAIAVATAMSAAKQSHTASYPRTPFQSSAVPGMSLADYAAHVASRCAHGEEAVLLGLVLMARYCRATGMYHTAYTEHRLLLACVVVASKVHYDDFYKNVYMARIGGVAKSELAELEIALLKALDYRANIKATELRALSGALQALGDQVLTATSGDRPGAADTCGRLTRIQMEMLVPVVARPSNAALMAPFQEMIALPQPARAAPGAPSPAWALQVAHASASGTTPLGFDANPALSQAALPRFRSLPALPNHAGVMASSSASAFKPTLSVNRGQAGASTSSIRDAGDHSPSMSRSVA